MGKVNTEFSSSASVISEEISFGGSGFSKEFDRLSHLRWWCAYDDKLICCLLFLMWAAGRRDPELTICKPPVPFSQASPGRNEPCHQHKVLPPPSQYTIYKTSQIFQIYYESKVYKICIILTVNSKNSICMPSIPFVSNSDYEECFCTSGCTKIFMFANPTNLRS